MRGKEHQVRISEEAKIKCIALSKKYGLQQKEIVSALIDLCVEFDLLEIEGQKLSERMLNTFRSRILIK